MHTSSPYATSLLQVDRSKELFATSRVDATYNRLSCYSAAGRSWGSIALSIISMTLGYRLTELMGVYLVELSLTGT